MEPDFWLQRWSEGRIGFHKNDTHPALAKQWPSLRLAADSNVFVPLCGKSRDMAWLATQGHRVCGVELAGEAISAFFAQEGLVAESQAVGALVRHRAGPYTLWQGDLFDLDASMLGEVAAIYDRAALIALPADLRRRYAAHLITLAADAAQLLICLDYDQSEYAGPPFSVSGDEVRALYSGHFDIDTMSRRVVGRDDGPTEISVLNEAVYRLLPQSMVSG